MEKSSYDMNPSSLNQQEQPSIPPLNAPTPNSISPRRLPILIVGIVLFLLVVGSASAGYLFMVNQKPKPQEPTPIAQTSPTPAPNLFADWKTYMDTQFNFSFQYPSQWKIEKITNPTDRSYSLRVEPKDTPREPMGGTDAQNAPIVIYISQTDYLNSGIDNPSNSLTDYNLSGMNAKQGVRQGGKFVVVKNNGRYFSFAGNGGDQSKQYLDAILSTFKLTDQNLSSTPTPSCMARPACLDTTPQCMIAEPANGWCITSPRPVPGGHVVTVTGVLSVIYGETGEVLYEVTNLADLSTRTAVIFHDDKLLQAAGGVMHLQGKQVTVTGVPATVSYDGAPTIIATAIKLTQ